MKNIQKVDENNEYVTKGFLKETLNEVIGNAIGEIVDAIGSQIGRLDKRIDTLEERFDGIESNMVTKKDLIQIHDNFVSRSEYTALSARVSLVEETIYE